MIFVCDNFKSSRSTFDAVHLDQSFVVVLEVPISMFSDRRLSLQFNLRCLMVESCDCRKGNKLKFQKQTNPNYFWDGRIWYKMEFPAFRFIHFSVSRLTQFNHVLPIHPRLCRRSRCFWSNNRSHPSTVSKPIESAALCPLPGCPPPSTRRCLRPTQGRTPSQKDPSQRNQLRRQRHQTGTSNPWGRLLLLLLLWILNIGIWFYPL